ncbi:MAG: TIGR04255 family protein [Planctomycetota bacterium]|jgi:uncharacterized protein (TIGR04255 family)
MTKKYENSPIVEVACEFRFPSRTAWDATVAGMFYGKVRKDFPEKETKQLIVSSLTSQPVGIQHEAKSEERTIFWTSDKKAFFQIGTRLLVIGCLKPYPEWPTYSSHIKTALETLTELVDIKTFERIGIRYINRIEIPKPTVELEKYFEFRPEFGSALPQEIARFQMSCFWVYENDRDACKVRMLNVPADKPNHTDFILDLDYYLARPEQIMSGEGLDWLEKAHSRVEELFEGCISDRLRELFKEVP